MEHNFGHGQQDLANVLASLNILAFLIHTNQGIIKPAYQRLRQALGARKTFFNELCALTRYIVFVTWNDLFRFMEECLKIVHYTPNPVLNLELLKEEVLVIMSDSSIITLTVPTTPLPSMRTEVGHFLLVR